MSKLRSVIRHEYLTIVKQPSFWIVMIAIPAVVAIIGLLVVLGNSSSQEHIDELAKDMKNIAIIDNSGLINKDVVESADLKISPASEFESLREQVRTDEIPALMVFPETLQKDRQYQLYLSSNDLAKMGSVSSMADSIL